MRSLPPLNALRAFEATARLASISRAAQELNVTQSAVSQQVKVLEEHFGMRLFRRHHGRLELTSEAHHYLPTISEALDRIDSAGDHLRALRGDSVLTIGVMATLAMRWLMPRLDRFRAAYPAIQLRLRSAPYSFDFEQQSVRDSTGRELDLAFQFGEATRSGLQYYPLFGNELFIVCSPGYLEGAPPLDHPADLAEHQLLRVTNPARDDDWEVWSRATGVDSLSLRTADEFEYSYLALEAAANGLGVAVTHQAFAASDLSSGRLVDPLRAVAPATRAYQLICSEQHAMLPKVALFRDWVLQEVAEEVGRSPLPVAV